MITTLTIFSNIRVGEDVVAKKPEEEREKRQQIKDQDTTWYHEGPPSLLDARLYVAGKNNNSSYTYQIIICIKLKNKIKYI